MTDCLGCGHHANLEPVSAVRGIWDGEFPVYFCSECELYFLSPVPETEVIDRYYQRSYWSHSRFREQLKKLFRYLRVTSQQAYLGNRISLENITERVVELGAADGRLIGGLDVKAEKIALEQSDYYQDFARRAFGFELIATDFNKFTQPCQLLLMSHVIEHFPDPVEAMRQASDLLVPGGHLFIEVPNSPMPGEFSEQEAYLNTEHMVNFRAKSLTALVERAGFSDIALSRWINHFPNPLTQKTKRRLAKTVLGAAPLHLLDTPWVVLYLISGLINPVAAFSELPVDMPYQGFGDNLRLIARKPG